MAIPIKSQKEIEAMRKGGQILAEVLDEVLKNAKIGISTWELDRIAEKLILEKGGKPGFKGYQGFPATLCTCTNEEIVHGIPQKDKILKDGDLLTIDCGNIFEGLYTDAARSIQIGQKTPETTRLIKTGKKALKRAFKIAQAGIKLQEISKIIQKTIEKAGYHVIFDLTGHGVGKKLHEAPVIPNFVDKRSPNPILEPGMTLAIEPIFAVGTSKMRTLKDDWTIVTIDNSLAAQVEETILITQNGNEILTKGNF
ncbi:type I methionyl aminopeptidase [Patescibacteria group bacterium]